MRIFDKLTLDAPRRTADGYLAASALVARAGIQLYSGRDVGKPDLKEVRVYRPPAEVFSKDAMASFAWRPVTNDHPSEAVSAANWKQYAVGQVGDEVARDGEAIRVPLVLMDAGVIASVEAGKRELSMGYDTDLVWGEGKTPEGLIFDAIQTNIRANHLAVVDRARGGPELRIGDETMSTADLRKIMVDGLQVETTDAGAAAITKLQGDIEKLVKSVSDANAATAAETAKLTAATAAHATALSQKDAEVATLKTQVLTPAALDAAIIARSKLIADAKRLAGDGFKADGLSDEAIRKAAVTAKLGDAACKDQPQAFFDHGFTYALAQMPAGTTVDPLRSALSDIAPVGDAGAKAWATANEREANAYKRTPAAH